MRRNKGGRATVVVMAGVLVITLVLRLIGRTHRQPQQIHPPAPTNVPKEFVHPFIPSPQVVKPAIAPCRARDLHGLVDAVRQTTKKFAPTLKKEKEAGAPVACRAEGDNRKWSAFVDIFAKDASGCVARDMELDSQWNQLQSAVTALDACADCTRPRAARETSCRRVIELLEAADKATPP